MIAESVCSKVEIDEMVVQSSQEFFGANSVFGPFGDVKTRIRKGSKKRGVAGLAWESGILTQQMYRICHIFYIIYRYSFNCK